MRYYFHLRESDDFVADEEGLELADLDAAREVALAGARSLMAGGALAGRIELQAVIEVTDEQGRPLIALPFSEAVTVDD